MLREFRYFNQDIGSWNVSQVRYMNHMFVECRYFNQDIGSWEVSQVWYMRYMFYGAAAFNQDIGGWDVRKVKFMNNMFHGTYFNQYIGKWPIISDCDVTKMFFDCGVSKETFEESSDKNIDKDANKILEDTEKKLFDIAENGNFNKKFVSFQEALQETVSMASAAFKN